jgi:hypothetical protein
MATSGGYGLGGFTGGAPPPQGMGQGGGSSPMDMQGFFGMLMQFLRRYSQGGGSMQPGQFPPPSLEPQMGLQAPQRARAFDQGFDYTQRRPTYQMQPARYSQPQPLTGVGTAPPAPEPAPLQAPVSQDPMMGMTRQAVV